MINSIFDVPNATRLCKYIKGTKCRNSTTGNTFTCSGQLSVDIDGDGLFDPDSGNYVFMIYGDSNFYWAEIISD